MLKANMDFKKPHPAKPNPRNHHIPATDAQMLAPAKDTMDATIMTGDGTVPYSLPDLLHRT